MYSERIREIETKYDLFLKQRVHDCNEAAVMKYENCGFWLEETEKAMNSIRLLRKKIGDKGIKEDTGDYQKLRNRLDHIEAAWNAEIRDYSYDMFKDYWRYRKNAESAKETEEEKDNFYRKSLFNALRSALEPAILNTPIATRQQAYRAFAQSGTLEIGQLVEQTTLLRQWGEGFHAIINTHAMEMFCLEDSAWYAINKNDLTAEIILYFLPWF